MCYIISNYIICNILMKNRISPLEMKMNYNTGTVGVWDVRDGLERDQDARKMIVFQENPRFSFKNDTERVVQ